MYYLGMKNLKILRIFYWMEIVLAVFVPLSFFGYGFLYHGPTPNLPTFFDYVAFVSYYIFMFGAPVLFWGSLFLICLAGILRIIYYRINKIVETETITKKLLLTSLLIFIGFLVCSVVVASLSTPRPRSADSIIGAHISNARPQFENYYAEHQSYLGGCKEDFIRTTLQAVESESKNPVICRDSEKEFVIEVVLVKPKKGKFLCVDSLGNMPTLDHQLAEGQMKCE
jgi:hypothetical protein